jgi:hypothetical protein
VDKKANLDENFSKELDILKKKTQTNKQTKTTTQTLEIKNSINQVKTQWKASPTDQTRRRKKYQPSKLRVRNYYVQIGIRRKEQS